MSDKRTFYPDLNITNIGDPFMLKVDPTHYYMYATSSDEGFYSWESNNMTDWKKNDLCYRKNDDSWGYECFWAPEVIIFKEKYYMLYTARDKKDNLLKLGLAVSDEPAGPFKDIKNAPFLDLGYATIDGNILIDDDGRIYLYFARDCSVNIVDGNHVSEIYVIELKKDLSGTIGKEKRLISPSLEWEKPQGGWGWNEGPEVLKHNGKYYLTYSANYFESPEYSIGYAVSDDPMGPFTKPENNRILYKGDKEYISGPGHHSFVYSPDDTELWVAYHSHTDIAHPSGDRKVNLCKAFFKPDGSLYFDGPLDPKVRIPLPSGVK